MYQLTVACIIVFITAAYSAVPTNAFPSPSLPQPSEHNLQDSPTDKLVSPSKEEQIFEEESRGSPPASAPKPQTNEERALKEVSKALELMLSVMEKIVVVLAVFAFIFVQYIAFKLFDYIHRCIQRQKALKKEAKKQANSQEMKSAPLKY